MGVSEGALFYGSQQRRHPVSFDVELRRLTEEAARRLHEIVAGSETPRVARSARCKGCSLVDVCVPGATGPGRSARHYIDAALSEAMSTDDGEP